MFGRHLEVALVKTRKGDTIVDATPSVTADDISHIAKKVITYVAIGAAATFAAIITLNTASEIAVNRLSITEKKEN